MSKKVDEKFFTKLEKYGNIITDKILSIIFLNPELKINLIFSKKLKSKNSQKQKINVKECIKRKVGEAICMISFTKRYVNIVSLIISIILFCFFNSHFLTNNNLEISNFSISSKIQEIITNLENENSLKTEQQNENKSNEQVENIEQKQEKNQQENTNEVSKNQQEFVWQIEIPSINLNALIAEGTSKETMDEFVGHFEETVKRNGNIGLAAHNRGYKVNYFQDLKKLKEGDEIIYKYKEFEKRYVVKTLKIISDEDWSLLENTEDNRITLITCVENEPNYRRLIQGIEKE